VVENKIKILAVDDSPENLVLIRLFIKGTNWDLDVAKNGEEAIEMVKSTRYDLILMDLEMPIMGGHEATEKIRQLEKENELDPACIIGLSGHVDESIANKMKELGANSFITKPFKKSEFVDEIVRVLSLICEGQVA
jgi:CheY-like chemotaxis protein